MNDVAAADRAATGAALARMTENELAKMRSEPRPALTPAPEPHLSTYLERLWRATQATVIRDMKERRAAVQEINKAQQRQDKATSIFMQSNLPADGEATYEMSDPNFL